MIGVKVLPGHQGYRRLFKLQKLINHRQQNMDPTVPPLILYLEHRAVYTAGRRIKTSDSLVEQAAKRLNSDVEYVDRGGQWTFHGPGQLIGYPLMNIKSVLGLSAKCYVDSLENAVIASCKRFGIQSVGKRPETGIWIDDKRKVGAIGIQLSRHCSMHGFAVNCNVDLDWFKHIVPCGITNLGVTSLERELERTVTVQDMVPVATGELEIAWKLSPSSLKPLNMLDPAFDKWINEQLEIEE